MAVPRAKTSKARTKRRQGINMRLTAPNLVECGTCGNMTMQHRICPKCGFYKGKQVIQPESGK